MNRPTALARMLSNKLKVPRRLVSNTGCRREDAAIHMRFGREVDYRIGLGFLEDPAQPILIAQIGLVKPIARIIGHRGQVLQVSGISELIDIHDLNGRYFGGPGGQSKSR